MREGTGRQGPRAGATAIARRNHSLTAAARLRAATVRERYSVPLYSANIAQVPFHVALQRRGRFRIGFQYGVAVVDDLAERRHDGDELDLALPQVIGVVLQVNLADALLAQIGRAHV